MTLLSTLQQIQWREPLWLLSAVVPLLLWAVRRHTRSRRNAAYADRELLPWVLRHVEGGAVRRIWSRTTAQTLVWPLLAIALAGPRLPLHIPGDEAHNGVDIMVVLDLSRSMTAADITPDRFQRARIELQELLPRLRGDRMGVMLFAGRPQLFVPLTYDRHAMGAYLNELQPNLLPVAGSDLAAALRRAGEALKHDSRAARAVLVISDGDTGSDGKAAQDAAAQLHTEGIPVYALGVGSAEGAGIALPGGGWLTRDGRPVITRLNERLLRHVAEAGGGKYARATDDDSDWQQLYDAGIGRLAAHSLKKGQAERMQWRELFPWALIPALLLLIASWLPLPGRATTLLMWLPVLLLATAGLARADDVASRAYAAYAHKDYARATELYRHMPGYAGRMGEGASAYRRQDFTAAVTAYSRAVLAAPDDHRRADALFDLGNSYFGLGDYARAESIYADVLRYRPHDAAARHNGGIADTLRKAVADELRGAPPRSGGRRGSFPRRDTDADFNPGMATMQLGKATPQQHKDTAATAASTDKDMAALIARGVARARIADSPGGANGTVTDAAPDPQALLAAQARMERLEERDAAMWKSLFELEEGFPGAVDEPRRLPGVAPW